jgi:hypothetical protein
MPQQLLNDFEFRPDTPQQRRVSVAKRVQLPYCPTPVFNSRIQLPYSTPVFNSRIQLPY